MATARQSNSQVTELDDGATEASASPAAQEAVKVDAGAHVAGLSGQRKTVIVQPTDGDLGNTPVDIGLNGHLYRLPRGVPCTIPVEVLEILQDAKQTLYTSGERGAINARTIHRFPFQVVA